MELRTGAGEGMDVKAHLQRLRPRRRLSLSIVQHTTVVGTVCLILVLTGGPLWTGGPISFVLGMLGQIVIDRISCEGDTSSESSSR